MKFEWDDQKNILNIRKHGISFEEAALVFNDLNRLEFYDETHSRDEDRYITIGLVNEVLVVVYTERKDITRLISARVAQKEEEEIYYDSTV